MRTVVVPSTLAWTFAALTPSISFAPIGIVMALGIRRARRACCAGAPNTRSARGAGVPTPVILA